MKTLSGFVILLVRNDSEGWTKCYGTQMFYVM